MQGRKRPHQRNRWKVIGVCVLFLLALFSALRLYLWTTQHRNSVFTIEGEKELNKENRQGSTFTGPEKLSSTQLQCRMESCFNFELCKKGFKVYLSPFDRRKRSKTSAIYLKIINHIRFSKYYTQDPSSACLFIPSIDTIDRDKLSRDYIHGLDAKFARNNLWNGGKNYVIFNLFSGTWPDYAESLAFNYGNAILAKASFSEGKLRAGFDISFPLFEKDHPSVTREDNYNAELFPLNRKYKIGFKGKRYLIGIGSEVRDTLHLLNNDKDIVLLTTCKHGKNWQLYKDDECDKDNSDYERYDYQELLYNATFCLVPRGRRLGSFRFLEALKAGCIPVVLSDGWELPFSSVIDWSKAVIRIHEKAVLQISIILRSISIEQILLMKQQGYFLYAAYFSSVEKIVGTTLKILFERVQPHMSASYHMWNYPPGVLHAHAEYSNLNHEFPFYYNLLGIKPKEKFTAILFAATPITLRSCRLFRLIETINDCDHIDQILVVWIAPARIPKKDSWPMTRVSLRVVYPGVKNINGRFLDGSLIKTDAVFIFNEDVIVNKEEVDFAFRTWRSFPDRLVGFTSRDHYWNAATNSWMYTSKISNEYSMIMLNAAVYHRYYNHLYMNHLPRGAWELVTKLSSCDAIAMNFLISSVTNQPPIKVAHTKYFNPGKLYREKNASEIENSDDRDYRLNRFRQRQKCFKELSRVFGRTTLKKSAYKLDPLLYLDPVSNFKKRYRQFEVPSRG